MPGRNILNIKAERIDPEFFLEIFEPSSIDSIGDPEMVLSKPIQDSDEGRDIVEDEVTKLGRPVGIRRIHKHIHDDINYKNNEPCTVEEI